MMRKESLEKQFNKMADEAGTGDGGAANQDRESRMKRNRMKVVNYAEADEALRQEMEELMEPIHRAPDDFEVIARYGQQPLLELREIAKRSLDVQAEFRTQARVFDKRFDEVQSGFDKMGGKDLMEALKNLTKAGGRGLAAGSKGLSKLIKIGVDKVTGEEKKRTEAEKYVNNMADELPKLYGDMRVLVKNLEESEKAIAEVMAQAIELGKARANTVRALNKYLGTKEEVVRRYQEEYIPQAQELYEESQDPGDKDYLDTVIKRLENFAIHMGVVEQARAESIKGGLELRHLMDNMEEQRQQIITIRNINEPQWVALLSSAGLAGASLLVQGTINKAGKLGDDLSDFSTNALDQTTKMLAESKGRGAVNPEKMLEAITRLQATLEETAEKKRESLRKIEEASSKVREAADRILDAAENVQNERILEATEDRATKKGSTPTNDNKEGQAPAQGRTPPRPIRKPPQP